MDSPKALPEQRGNCPEFDLISVTEKTSPVALSKLKPRMKAKFFKIQPHRIFHGYDALIWIDGNVQIKSDSFVAELLAALDGNQVAIARHPCRNCVYEEAAFIADSIKKGSKYLKTRYDPKVTLKNTEVYRANGHPADWGLFWCGLFARRVDDATDRFFDEWWAHCLTWPKAIDQIPFAVLARRMELKMGIMDWGNFYENPSYKLIPHLKLQ